MKKGIFKTLFNCCLIFLALTSHISAYSDCSYEMGDIYEENCLHDTPSIPSPAEMNFLSFKNDNDYGVSSESTIDLKHRNRFPDAKLIDFIYKVETKKASGNQDFESFREQLINFLPPGKYYFDRRCPLSIEPNHNDKSNEFIITCMGGNSVIERNSLGKIELENYLWLNYPQPGKIREVLAYAELKEVQFINGKIKWQWQINELEYKNRILNLIRNRHPDLMENDMLDSNIINQLFPEIIRLISTTPIRNKNEIQEAINTGYWIDFNSNCPLQIKTNPILDSTRMNVILRLKPHCAILSAVDNEITLLLPKSVYYNQLREEMSLTKKFTAKLKINSFYWNNRKLHIYWDTITNINPISS